MANGPDIIICTPGRMIDMARNSPGVTLADIEVLVLDEADRLLDMGFRPELEELVSYLPTERQTCLFSATLTDDVLTLAKMSMKSPKRISVDPTLCLADHLTQVCLGGLVWGGGVVLEAMMTLVSLLY